MQKPTFASAFFKSKFLICLVAFIVCAFSANRLHGEIRQNEQKQFFNLLRKNIPGGRPASEIPIIQNIECIYDNGTITLNFDHSEGSCFASVTDPVSGTSRLVTFNSDDLFIELPGTYSPLFSITVNTSFQNIYVDPYQIFNQQ